MQKFNFELKFDLQSVVAHVDNVTEETTIDVLDDRAHADLVITVRTRKIMIMIKTI